MESVAALCFPTTDTGVLPEVSPYLPLSQLSGCCGKASRPQHSLLPSIPVSEGFLLTLFPRFWVFLSLLYGGVGGCHGRLKGWPRTHDPVGPRPPQGCRLSLAPQPAALIGGDAEAPRRDSSPAVIGGRRATSSGLRLLRPRPLVVRGKPKANAPRVFCGPCYRVFRGWGSGYRLFFRSSGVRSGCSRRESLPPRAGGYSRGLRETDGGDRGGKRGEPAGQRGCGGKTFTETER